MTTVYLLFYDPDTGSREEWNYNYTPCESFSNPEDREKRIEYLKTSKNDDGDSCEYEFLRYDIETMTSNQLQNPPEFNVSPRGEWTYSHEYLQDEDT
jgi:hypothetical protein